MKLIRTTLLLTLLATVARAQSWDVAFAQRGPNGPISAIAAHAGRIYIGGEFTEVDGVAARNVAVFDGTRWSALGDGVDDRVNAIAVTDDGVYVGGEFNMVGTTPIRGLALYSGGQWSSLATAEIVIDGSVNALAIAGDDLFVGGSFALSIDGAREQAIAILSLRDRTWRGLGGGVRVRGASWGEVLAIAANERYAYVAGLFSFVNIGGAEIESPGIARWDRQLGAWDALGGIEPIEPDALEVARAVAIDGEQVWALGDFRAIDGVEADGIARFDESRDAWEDVDLSGLSFGTAVAARSATVYAANASSLVFPGDALVTRSGSGEWRESGAAIKGSIYAVTYAPNGDLYVGGEFDTARGAVVRNIIRMKAAPGGADNGELASTPMIRSIDNGGLTLLLPDGVAGDAHVIVHDLLGREIVRYALGVTRGLRHLDLPATSRGAYLVSVRLGDRVETIVIGR